MFKSAAVAALAATAVATPQAPGWYDEAEFAPIGRSPSNAKVTFSVAMPHSNMEQLEKTVLDVSDPSSPNYGKWMTQEAVNKLTAVNPADQKAVRNFLGAHGAKCVESPHAFTCTAAVASVELMLSTKMTAFAHKVKGNKVHHRLHPTQKWTFPEALKGKVSFISGLGDFPSVKRRHGNIHGFDNTGKVTVETAGSSDDDPNPQPPADSMVVTMETLQNLYKVPTNPYGNAGSTGGPAEFQDDQAWATSDEQLFIQQNSIPVFFNATKKIGPFDPSSPDAEASLDWQYYGGVAYNNNLWYLTQALWM
jgi:tripeptidyl-peptidase I